jgi:Bacterial tandem repeat domain 1
MRRTRSLIALALVASAVVPATAHAAQPPVAVTVQPVAGANTVMAKVAPAAPGDPARWELNYYFDITNTNPSGSVSIVSVALNVNGGTTSTPVNRVLGPGERRLFSIPSTPGDLFPAPTTATATVNVRDYDPFVKPLTLALYQSPTQRGAYDFPLGDSDLPKGAYWGNFERTDFSSHHHGDLPQYYAYDILGYKFDSGSGQWLTRPPNSTATDNASYYAWNRPLRAIGDGTILECRRSLPDNTPGVMDGAHRFGNGIWIKLDSGEVVAYAHTKQFSIPSSLCPTESVSVGDAADGKTPVHAQPKRVYAGQVIARIGNTGNTGEPHTHMQLVANPPLDVDDTYSLSGPGLPLNFDGYRTRSREGLTQGSGFDWVDVPRGQGAVLPDFALLQPHVCGWNPPPPGLISVTLTGLSEKCFQVRFDDAVRAGYLPIAIDGYTIAGKPFFNVLLRPKRPATAAFAGMTKAEFSAKRSSLEGKGYRLIHLDLYLRGASALRYNGVWVKDGGPKTTEYAAKSVSDHTKQFKNLTGKGYVPLAISAVVHNGQTVVSAVYEKKNAGKFAAVGGVSLSKLQAEFDKQVKAGLRPTYVDAYRKSGKPYFSLIFTQKASKNFKMRHNLTHNELVSTDRLQRIAGRRGVALAGYQVGSKSSRFAAIWRK